MLSDHFNFLKRIHQLLVDCEDSRENWSDDLIGY